MKTVFTAAELMFVALQEISDMTCIVNGTPDEPEKPARVFWCWSHDIRVNECDYRKHDLENCDIEEEGGEA